MAKFPTIEEFAKSVADKVLDDYEYEGKTIREWVELILKGELAEVVRCKDCAWYREDGSICVNSHCSKSYYGCRVRQDHFCSYGERREDNEKP